MPKSVDLTMSEMADTTLAIEELEYHSDLEPFSGYAARKKPQLIKEMKKHTQLVQKGYQLILDDLSNQPERKNIHQELVNTYQSKIEEVSKESENKKSFQEILGLSNEILLDMYDVGAKYFENKEYEKSLAVFTFLTMLNDTISSFWIGVGSAYRALKDFDNAISAYYEAIFCDPASIEPYAQAASCYLAMNDKNKARKVLAVALEIARSDDSGDEDLQELQKEAERCLQSIEEKK